MRLERFGNFVANKNTTLSSRQSYASDEVSFKPLYASGAMFTVGALGLLYLLLGKRK